MPSNRSDAFLGPRGVPLLGSLLEFGSDPLSFFTRYARDYGDCCAMTAITRRVSSSCSKTSTASG